MYAYKESIYENFIEILSDPLKNAIPKLKQVIPDNRGGLFCDVPIQHLWLELAINQIGYPYHSNSQNHRRYNYIAKKREMALDIFTFDKCRAFYDWLPMVEYYIDDLSIIERQIITRSCMDAIGKHTFQNNLDELYYGSALLCVLERSYSGHYNIPLREK